MWKLVLGVILSFGLVACGPTQEEKKQAAINNMVSHNNNGNKLHADGEIMGAAALDVLDSKPISRHTPSDLLFLKEKFLEAKKKLESSNTYFDLVLRTDDKKEDNQVELTEAKRREIESKISRNNRLIREIEVYIKRIDREFDRQIKEALSSTGS